MKTSKKNIRRMPTGIHRLFDAAVKRAACACCAAALLLAGCDKENHDPDADPFLRISPTAQDIVFSAEAGEIYTYKVSTNQPAWIAESDQSWCKVHIDAGKSTMTLTALPNETTVPSAPATITLTAGKATPLTIAATQTPVGPTLRILPAAESLSFSAEAPESHTFEVITNQSAWRAESDQNWCKVSIEPDNHRFTVTALPNEATEQPKPATITITAGEAAPLTIVATQQAAQEAEYDLYISGYFSADEGRFACYWKNGEQVILPSPDGENRCQTCAITVSDGVIYISGHGSDVGCYWKGEECVVLPESYNTCSIAVDNGTVYVLSPTFYWKNGVVHTDIGDDFIARKLVVSEGKPYIAGQMAVSIDGNNDSMAACGEAGSPALLSVPEGSVSSEVKSMSVSGGSICVSGYCYNQKANVCYPVYWIDGVCTVLELPEGTSYGQVDAVCIYNGDVYASGYYQFDGHDEAVYWVNGKRTKLELPSHAVYVSTSGMAVADGKTYISARYTDKNLNYYACCWIDGQRFDLQQTPGTFSQSTTGIALVKR